MNDSNTLAEKPTPVVTSASSSDALTELHRLRMQQSLIAGALAGFAACLVAAVIWAVVTYYTEMQIGYMAVAVGFLVGFAVRLAGKGVDKSFGILGGGLALLGCLIGNVLAIAAFAAAELGVTVMEVIPQLNIPAVFDIMVETFTPMDLLFYGLAIWCGFTCSFSKVSEA